MTLIPVADTQHFEAQRCFARDLVGKLIRVAEDPAWRGPVEYVKYKTVAEVTTWYACFDVATGAVRQVTEIPVDTVTATKAPVVKATQATSDLTLPEFPLIALDAVAPVTITADPTHPFSRYVLTWDNPTWYVPPTLGGTSTRLGLRIYRRTGTGPGESPAQYQELVSHNLGFPMQAQSTVTISGMTPGTSTQLYCAFFLKQLSTGFDVLVGEMVPLGPSPTLGAIPTFPALSATLVTATGSAGRSPYNATTVRWTDNPGLAPEFAIEFVKVVSGVETPVLTTAWSSSVAPRNLDLAGLPSGTAVTIKARYRLGEAAGAWASTTVTTLSPPACPNPLANATLSLTGSGYLNYATFDNTKRLALNNVAALTAVTFGSTGVTAPVKLAISATPAGSNVSVFQADVLMSSLTGTSWLGDVITDNKLVAKGQILNLAANAYYVDPWTGAKVSVPGPTGTGTVGKFVPPVLPTITNAAVSGTTLSCDVSPLPAAHETLYMDLKVSGQPDSTYSSRTTSYTIVNGKAHFAFSGLPWSTAHYMRAYIANTYTGNPSADRLSNPLPGALGGASGLTVVGSWYSWGPVATAALPGPPLITPTVLWNNGTAGTKLYHVRLRVFISDADATRSGMELLVAAKMTKRLVDPYYNDPRSVSDLVYMVGRNTQASEFFTLGDGTSGCKVLTGVYSLSGRVGGPSGGKYIDVDLGPLAPAAGYEIAWCFRLNGALSSRVAWVFDTNFDTVGNAGWSTEAAGTTGGDGRFHNNLYWKNSGAAFCYLHGDTWVCLYNKWEVHQSVQYSMSQVMSYTENIPASNYYASPIAMYVAKNFVQYDSNLAVSGNMVKDTLWICTDRKFRSITDWNFWRANGLPIRLVIDRVQNTNWTRSQNFVG